MPRAIKLNHSESRRLYDSCQLCPVNVTNRIPIGWPKLDKDTLPKLWGPRDSTYVGYSLIPVLMKMRFGKRKGPFGYCLTIALTHYVCTQKIATGINIFFAFKNIYQQCLFAITLIRAGVAVQGPLVVSYFITGIAGSDGAAIYLDCQIWNSLHPASQDGNIRCCKSHRRTLQQGQNCSRKPKVKVKKHSDHFKASTTTALLTTWEVSL